MATTITDSTGLQNMKNDLTEDYVLGNNIDAGDIANFEPVGGWNSQDPFTGSFDGKGYQILNLTVNRGSDDYIGLFGEASGATLKNVHFGTVTLTGDDRVGALVGRALACCTIQQITVDSITITADDYVGGIIGHLQGGTFDDLTVTAGTIASDYYTGGVIGKAEEDTSGYPTVYGYTINDCHSGATVTGEYKTGGVIGQVSAQYTTCTISQISSTGNVTDERAATCSAGGVIGCALNCSSYYLTLSESCATGDVSAADSSGDAGGLIGVTGDLTINDSYAKGDVTAGDDGGGLISSPFNGVHINRCYATGSVTAGGTAGGLCGGTLGGGVINDSFWDTEASGEATSVGGTGKTTAQMKDISTFANAGWGISRIWNITSGCNGGYPCLINVNECCPQRSDPLDPTIAPQKVTLEAIRNLEIMNNARSYVNKSGSFVWESRFHRG